MPATAWPAERPARSLGAVNLRATEVHPCVAYPELFPEGGPPMGAGFIHNDAACNLRDFIQLRLEARGLERFRIATDVYLYASAPHEDMQRAAPDVFVYLEIRPDRGQTGTFHAAFDGPPDLVIEILSRSTRTKDIGVGGTLASKKRFYQRMGVPEYWVYDPERWRGAEAAMLEGFRLAEGVFVPIAPDDGLWYSAVLEAEWGIGPPLYDGVDRYAPMRLLDPVTNEWYPLPNEQRLALDEQAVQIDEQATQIDEQAVQIDEQAVQIDEQAVQIDEQATQIDKQKTYIANQKAYIADLERRLGLGGAGPSDSSDAERA